MMSAFKLPSVYNLLTYDSVNSTNSKAIELALEGEKKALLARDPKQQNDFVQKVLMRMGPKRRDQTPLTGEFSIDSSKIGVSMIRKAGPFLSVSDLPNLRSLSKESNKMNLYWSLSDLIYFFRKERVKHENVVVTGR